MKLMLLGVIVCLQLFSDLLVATPAVEQKALAACADQNLVITVDNILVELYVDGCRVTNLPNADNWQRPDTVRIPASTKVIAVKGEDLGAIAGILASGANFVSDGSWKCTATYSEGWQTVSFDDSRWPAATVIGKNGVWPWGKIAGISNNANWIWTPKYHYGPCSDKVVYCRVRLPACDRCAIVGTGSSCIRSCDGVANGDYQSCNGCHVYATCINGNLIDNRPCAPNDPPFVWDDVVKRCERSSDTCATCVN